MKKIFAIALALVMVLSMASAFAMTCGTIDWACATTTYNCGTATVEVVPYVVANDCDGKGATYVESNCAAAVFGEKVYYAVKINVPADINDEWFAAAELEVELTGLTGVEIDWDGVGAAIKTAAGDKFADKALTYYLSGTNAVIASDADNFEFVPGVSLWTATVTNAKTAKVCATLTSKVEGTNRYIEVGPYKIAWRSGKIDVWNGKEGTASKQAIFTINDNDLIEKVEYYHSGNQTAETFTDFGFVNGNGTASGYCAPYDWLKAAMEYFKLNFRDTCFTEKAFKANFGWDNEVKSCFTYSSNASAVVDAECVVAIPKTGDASVLAWLF